MSGAATLEGHTLLASGKVREIYDEGDRLLMVASDRISTYDVVHPTPIPDKGKVLTGLSEFWFERPDIAQTTSSLQEVPAEAAGGRCWSSGRDGPGECVCALHHRSGWKDYQTPAP